MKLKMMFVSLISTLSLNAEPLKVGTRLPELKGKNQDGKEVAIKAADGDQWMVIFTYPKALTGG
ncbi:MAG: redoxin domain-containing protein [Akkermansiaceae bacterium]|jgi:peroxiredoxin|nr:redoxin domain-containing protein [Akkermansiaceae bacterium]